MQKHPEPTAAQLAVASGVSEPSALKYLRAQHVSPRIRQLCARAHAALTEGTWEPQSDPLELVAAARRAQKAAEDALAERDGQKRWQGALDRLAHKRGDT